MQVLAQVEIPDIKQLAKLWLFEVWAKKFGAKVILKDIAIEQRGNQRLFAIAYLNSPIIYRKSIIELADVKAFEDIKLQGVVGVFLINWNRPVGFNVINKVLQKFGKVFDYIVIIAERFSGIVEDRYGEGKDRIRIVTQGDIVSELRREGVL